MACRITICMGSSCFSRGNSVNLEVLENFISKNNLDALIELVGSRCDGKCCLGPMITIDEQAYNNVDSGVLLDILKKKFSITDR